MFGYLLDMLNNMLFVNKKFYYLSLIKEKDDISIHGLWPQYDEKTYPQFCKKVNFSIEKLSPIINDLNTHWYSKDGETKNKNFWKHEYDKHGSCMFQEMTELEYFEKTLELFFKAKKEKLIDKYISKDTSKILIPVNLDFTFN